MAKPSTKAKQARAPRGTRGDAPPSFPPHDAELDSLARIEGQVRGIRKMIEERRYCVDILVQARAVHAALRQVERNVFSAYLQTCVTRALSGDSAEDREHKLTEIMQLFNSEPIR